MYLKYTKTVDRLQTQKQTNLRFAKCQPIYYISDMEINYHTTNESFPKDVVLGLLNVNQYIKFKVYPIRAKTLKENV